jgi:hypothetical protein
MVFGTEASILPQRSHRTWDVECPRPHSNSGLTGIRWVGTHCSISLTSSAPEHVSQHSRGSSRPTGWDRLYECRSIILIGAAEIRAIWDRIISDNP